MAIAPTPIVALNRAVAVAEVSGAVEGLELVGQLDLDGFHAIRADLLRRLGRTARACEAYDAAIACANNTAEHDFLQRRQQELG